MISGLGLGVNMQTCLINKAGFSSSFSYRYAHKNDKRQTSSTANKSLFTSTNHNPFPPDLFALEIFIFCKMTCISCKNKWSNVLAKKIMHLFVWPRIWQKRPTFHHLQHHSLGEAHGSTAGSPSGPPAAGLRRSPDAPNSRAATADWSWCADCAAASVANRQRARWKLSCRSGSHRGKFCGKK